MKEQYNIKREHTFRVNGKIHGKGRPRVTAKVTYTPKATKEYESIIRLSYIESVKNGAMLFEDCPVFSMTECKFAIPSYVPNCDKQMFLDGFIACTKKPDEDNIKKIVNDALNGYAYTDDIQIVTGLTYKSWTDKDEYMHVSLSRISGITLQEYLQDKNKAREKYKQWKKIKAM